MKGIRNQINQDKPREHEAIELLGEVAAYYAAWHPPLRATARALAAVARRRAADVGATVGQLAPHLISAPEAEQVMAITHLRFCVCSLTSFREL